MLDIKTAKVARIKCQLSLLFHFRYFFKAQTGLKANISAHHEIICEALERVLLGQCRRLIITLPPRYGKTDIAVKAFISHALSLNPGAKFIHLSYSDSLALDNSSTVKDTINSEMYQQLFPEVKIKKDSTAKEKWYTTKGGGVLARSAAGSVTGFGAGSSVKKKDWTITPKELFGGAIVIDDSIKPDDADSDTIRERVNDRFDSTIRSRVNNRETPIIVIMQRLHPNDMAGYLQREGEADKWEVINLPAINEAGNKYGLPIGEALWPFKHSLDELQDLKRANDIVFERQYMQNPAPKSGLLFPPADLQYYEPESINLTDPDHNYICADPAGDGGDDFAVLDTRLIGDKIYIPNVIYNTNGTDFNEKQIVDLVRLTRCNNVGIEGVMGWVETAVRVRTELQEKGFQGDVRVLRPRTGKHARITNRSAFIRNNFVFRKDWQELPEYAKFMRNLTTYLKIQEAGRGNKHDDAPDICEMGAGYYEKNFPHLWMIK